MAYTHTTWTQLQTQLSLRLNDPSQVFWTAAEVANYLTEALRTWGSVSQYGKGQGAFNTSTGVAVYDIATAIPGLEGITLLDTDLITDIKYALMENATTTELFTTTDIVNAMNNRRNQFLLDTGSVITRSVVALPASAAASGKYDLPDTVMDVRRVVWGATNRVLHKSDTWASLGASNTWNVAVAEPLDYSVFSEPVVQIQLIPPPTVSSGQTLVLDTISAPTALTGAGVLLNISDDYAWVIKWGVLADLLGKEGISADPGRAAYCEQRYKIGVELASVSNNILMAQVNGKPVYVNTIWDLDHEVPGWEGLATAAPTMLAVAGDNLLYLHRVPNGAYAVTLDVVRNSQIPSAGGNYVQVGREYLDAILGYAQHLAAFKLGGAEFEATKLLGMNMLAQAAKYSERERAMAIMSEAMKDIGNSPSYANPLYRGNQTRQQGQQEL